MKWRWESRESQILRGHMMVALCRSCKINPSILPFFLRKMSHTCLWHFNFSGQTKPARSSLFNAGFHKITNAHKWINILKVPSIHMHHRFCLRSLFVQFIIWKQHPETNQQTKILRLHPTAVALLCFPQIQKKIANMVNRCLFEGGADTRLLLLRTNIEAWVLFVVSQRADCQSCSFQQHFLRSGAGTKRGHNLPILLNSSTSWKTQLVVWKCDMNEEWILPFIF